MSQHTQTIDQEPTLRDVIDAINAASTDTAIQFSKIDDHFKEIDERLEKIETTMVTNDQLKKELGQLESRMASKEDLKRTMVKMVTKEYLDDKLADFKADIVGLIRKEDTKVITLVQELDNNKVISPQITKVILALEPFPQS